MQVRRLGGLVAFIFSFQVLIGKLQASPLLVEVKPNGEERIVSITAAQAGLKEIHFWTISRGNMTSPLSVALRGPAGLKAEVDALKLKKDPAQALLSTQGWYAVQLKNRLQTRRTAVMYGRDSCPWLTPEIYRQLLAYFQLLGQHPTWDEICEMFGGGGADPTPPPAGGGSGGGSAVEYSVNSSGILEKDTCGSGSNARYLVRFRVNLQGVDPNLFAAGFEVGGSIQIRPWKGRTATLLKPKSDGGIFKGPILLMTSMGGFYYGGGETIKVYKWRNDKPRLLKSFKVDPARNYVFYQGKIFTRVPVGSVLHGGKATFDLVGPYSAYSVCLKLRPVRQEINGFP